MISDYKWNRFWLFQAFNKSHFLPRSVTEQKTNKHAIETQLLFLQDFELNATYSFHLQFLSWLSLSFQERDF